MYFQLGSIDIVTTDAAIQTDHRTTAEIEAAPELAALLAIARIVITRAHTANVIYACQHQPPAFFVDVVRNAGAALTWNLDGEALPATPVSTAVLDATVDALFRGLAARLGVEQPEQALPRLIALEDATLDDAPEEDTPQWHTRALELAAIAIVGLEGNVVVDGGYSLLPFVLKDGDGLTNVVGKAERFIERGPTQRPSMLFSARADQDVEGTACVVLRAASWNVAIVNARPLVDDAPAGLPIPWLVAAEDRPSSWSYPKRDENADDAAINAVIDTHLAAHIALELGGACSIDDDGVISTAPAELLLARGFLEALQQQIEARALITAVPSRNALLVCNADDAVAVAALKAQALHDFDDATVSGQELSPALFSVIDGALIGLVDAAS
ncbi:MAG TPA: hypothetical protein VGF99_09725 [Myxococcota bacterium]